MTGINDFKDFKLSETEFAKMIVDEMLEEQVIISLLTVVQDGICFLSKDLDILYGNPAMRYWYELKKNKGKSKCYEAYHNRKTPCEGCPVLKSLETKQPEMGEQAYETGRARQGWQNIYCVPVLDDQGEVILCIEYIRDVTDKQNANLSIDLMKSSIQTMTDHLKKLEKEHREKEQQLVANMNKTLNTVLRYLEKMLDPVSFELISRQLEISGKGVEQHSGITVRLSMQETMIAKYIADGYVSKEIADEMQISKKTVDYHRTNLRKKLGLGPNDNLRQAVQEFLIKNGL